MYRSDPTKQSYIVDTYFNVSEPSSPEGARYKLVGDNRNFNPGFASSILNVIAESGVRVPVFVELSKDSLYFLRVKPINTAGKIHGSFLVVELPGEATRTREDVLNEMNAANNRWHEGWYSFTTPAEIYLEKTINDHQIIQPVQQATAAVADELNLVSTSAFDTLAGLGAQKVTFDYWDDSWVLHENNVVNMSGTTQVDLITAGYTDVYLIKRAWVSQAGALGYNEGSITFEDDAV